MPRQRSSAKRQEILAGAFKVFARDGYTRASIDAIAVEAGASTRTIYNYFDDKAHLFRSVIEDSAHQVAEAQIRLITLHLGKIIDLEADLIAFGKALSGMVSTPGDHFALVRQINAEAGHIPQDAIDAWQQTGPLRVRQALADRLDQIPELRSENPLLMALHLMKLVSDLEPSYRARRLEEAHEAVATGVRCFLYGYTARVSSAL